MMQYFSVLPLALLGFFPLCAPAQVVEITVYNRTGLELDSVAFENVFLGKLSADTSVFVALTQGITMQGEVPLFRPVAHVEGKPKQPLQLKCSTKSRKVYAGHYALDVRLYETPAVFRLYWEPHK